MASDIRRALRQTLRAEQRRICAALAQLDGQADFVAHDWQRAAPAPAAANAAAAEDGTGAGQGLGGGGGTSCVLQGGRHFEKAGVNVSEVQGTLPLAAAQAMGGGQAVGPDDDLTFYATGLSLIVHPHHPRAPSVHANYRYFERGSGATPDAWWFGGGADLTPAYLYEEDVAHFHRHHKDACDRHDPAFYPRFKAWADRYFYIPHRQETRGVGGIFFDNLCDRPAAALLAFVQDCLAQFLPAYLPLVERRKDGPFTAQERAWQQVRRGRYVEFNLLYDRGTTFGLKTGGRVESILVSLPLTARWEYDPPAPAPASPEGRLLAAVRRPRAWLP